MDIIEFATSPWGQNVPIHIGFFLIWVVGIAGLAFLIVSAARNPLARVGIIRPHTATHGIRMLPSRHNPDEPGIQYPCRARRNQFALAALPVAA